MVEGAYGALKAMRRVLAEVMSSYVEKGYLTISDALEVAERVLCRNARELLRI